MSTDVSADTGPAATDIARARASMASSVEAVADRVAPKKVIARAKMKFSAKVEELKDRFHPVRVVQRKLGSSRPAVGSGAGVLAARGVERSDNQLPAGR